MPEVKTTPDYILLGLGHNLFTLSIIYPLDTLDCILLVSARAILLVAPHIFPLWL
jgi:hypothetical protein